MSNYKNYDCFSCSHWYNCGKETVMLNYKFNRDGNCHAYSPERQGDEIEQNTRIRDFEKSIEWRINNRIPKELW